MRKPRNRVKAEPVEEAPKQSAITGALDFPPGVFGREFSQISLSGNREAVVEGCCGVLEYENALIRLSLGKMMVQFTGRGLQIKCMTGDSVIIEGYILGIEFIS